MTEIETHPFEPFVPDNMTVLIIGSFPGKGQTAIDNWYYGAKRNQFWKILSAVYGTELNSMEAKKALFKKVGIGITDIFLKIRRKTDSNLDTNLEIIEPNTTAIKPILQNPNLKSIFFTSKFVEKEFNKLFPDIKMGESLPSPSPRYARMTKDDKINHYKSKLPK